MEALISPLPRISIQAFCATPEVAAVVQAVASDRRADKAHLRVQTGGIEAALEAYRNASSPNVIIVEMVEDRASFLGHIDRLAEHCDPTTKVFVIGHTNDVILYRELMRRGISEYLIAPVDVVETVRAISEMFTGPMAEPVGRTIAVMGTKGGTGSSTVAHNLGWMISSELGLQTLIVDLDLGFGTAGLDFNQDPSQGIADAMFANDRLDATLVDRLMTKCSDHLNLLAAPAILDRAYDFEEGGFDSVLDILRPNIPCIILDIPHLWTGWSRRLLLGADEIVLVAEPDLANLRNAKNMADEARKARPNDSSPHLVLNRVGVTKRPEIAAAEFAKALDLGMATIIPFDANLFGTAANNGQMIAEVQAKGKVTDIFSALAQRVTGRAQATMAKRSVLQPFLARLRKKA
jgi:pilus assembly protein CpaE